MPRVVITGANRGIGLALCQHYLACQWQVIATCRQPALATELRQLASSEKLSLHSLNIDEPESLQHFIQQIDMLPVDILINNAGQYGPKGYSLEQLDFSAWQKVLQTNVLSTSALTLAMLPLLRRGEAKKIAFLSSKMGSINDNQSGGSYIYRSSKAALNAVIKSFSLDLENEGIAVISLHPGWVQTDMGGPNALISSSTSASGLKQQIDYLNINNSGRFIDYTGQEIPW